MYLSIMQIIKYILLIGIFGLSTSIGLAISKTYENRVIELKEFKNILNVIKTKIKFTYEPLAEIFKQIANKNETNIEKIFGQMANQITYYQTREVWENCIQDADISINHFSVRSFSFAHFRIHTLTAATEQQASQKRFITAWLSERFGFIAFQRFLNLYPHLTRNQTRMLANRYNPFTCRKILCGSAFFLIGTVVSHNTVLVIKGIFLREQVCVILNKEIIGIFICNHINRILQNSFDGKTSKVIVVLSLDTLFNQSRFGQCQRICFYI